MGHRIAAGGSWTRTRARHASDQPVLAFDAAHFNPEVMAVAKQGNAQVFVDRPGAADNPAAWAEAVQ
jgi:hypothetical protein